MDGGDDFNLRPDPLKAIQSLYYRPLVPEMIRFDPEWGVFPSRMAGKFPDEKVYYSLLRLSLRWIDLYVNIYISVFKPFSRPLLQRVI
jgi:hypothetical protein